MDGLDRLSTAHIAQSLPTSLPCTKSEPAITTGRPFREAGVLIPFVRIANSWHILFIRRPMHERDPHAGQVAFAGGKREQTDIDLTATALREAEEEIGINRTQVNVLGQLTPHYSLVSSFRILPVVGVLEWPTQLRLNPQEVARAFTIPLNWLADPGHYEIRYQHIANSSTPVENIYFNEYDGELLWGATARMTLSLLACLKPH